MSNWEPLEPLSPLMTRMCKSIPSQPNQRRTLNKLPPELSRRNFANKHRLSIQICGERAKMCTQRVRIPTELPSCIPPLLVGHYQVLVTFFFSAHEGEGRRSTRAGPDRQKQTGGSYERHHRGGEGEVEEGGKMLQIVSGGREN